MGEVKSIGKKSSEALSGRISLEEDNNRLIMYDENKIPSAIFGQVLDGSTQVEVAQPGYNILTCTDDQKILSSKFNMYKVISSGTLTLEPRDEDITLATTTIGYQYRIKIKDVVPTGKDIIGSLLVRVLGKWESLSPSQMDIKGSGNFYDNGTNKAIFDYHYFVQDRDLYIIFNVRLTAGSLSFNPKDIFAGTIYWEICNQTNRDAAGGGGTNVGDGKYYYLDYIIYNTDGTTNTALASSLAEFYNGESNHFPKPKLKIPGYNRF